MDPKVQLLSFAKEIAVKAGNLTRDYFRKEYDIRSKIDESPVTTADLQAESLLRSLIEEAFPHHSIIGEEGGKKNSVNEVEKGPHFTWVLDPIDGTKSFIKGIPLYTTLVAVLQDGVPIVGVIYNPILEELTSAALGFGTEYNGSPVRVSDCEELSKAWFQVTDPTSLLSRHPRGGAELMTKVGHTRTWADGHAYAMLARGEADIVIDPIMNLWDIACLQPIIREAGGTFTDIHGLPDLGTSAIATNGKFHDQVVAFFSS